MTEAKGGVIWSIQYLRGIAALMVVWHHARDQIPGLQQIFAGSFGTSGVDLFFVISGFIMVSTTARSHVGPLQFMQRRIIRVVPLYWLLTSLMVAVWTVKPSLFKTLDVSDANLIQSLFFIPHFSNSFTDKVWPLLVPGWTLNYEMFFYFVFSLSLMLPKLLRIPAVSVLFIVLVGAGYVFAPTGSPVAITYTNAILLEFVLGMWIAHFWLGGQFALSPIVSGTLFIVGSLMLVMRDTPPLGNFTQIVGAALVITSALQAKLNRWHISILKLLGDSSYSLYLTHIFTLGVLRMVWMKLFSSQVTIYTGGAFMAVALLACCFVGYAVYAYIESPLTRRLNQVQRSKNVESV